MASAESAPESQDESPVPKDMKWIDTGGKDDYQTPPGPVRIIRHFFGIDVDPCPGEDTRLGMYRNIRPEENGLVVDWSVEKAGPVTAYCNPPFSKPSKRQWLWKGVSQFLQGHVDRVVFCLPDSTDVKRWWHAYVARYCPYTWFPYGRLSFYDPEKDEQKTQNTGGTAFPILGPVPDEFREWTMAEEHGDLVERPAAKRRLEQQYGRVIG